ncbi:RES domain-containing protein [Rossellomorea aquimaris]|uniref:RES domain-containing protein n=1 Tax=Rossellomorea aquimaris TaxID=189382 RepID=UPI0037C66566
MSDYIFVEQKKGEKEILTVAVQMNNGELESLAAQKKYLEEATIVLSDQISWEDASNDLRNFISLYIADLSIGPEKNRFNHLVNNLSIERQLEQRQQSLEDFAINDLINGAAKSNCKVFIKGNFDRIYTNKQIIDEKTEGNKVIGFILTNFLLWSESKNATLELIRLAYKNDLDEFQQYINKYPSLGAYHSMGKKIIDAIGEIGSTNIDKSIYFRAREVNASIVLSQDDLGAPKSEYVKKEGRYNHIGIPVMYLASDKKTCVAEMMENHESKLLWFQEFIVNEVQVLDLTTDPGKSITPKHSLLIAALIYEGVINQDSERERIWKPEYYIPRFVADVAKMIGAYDGIKFSSNRGQGNNLALFNWLGKVNFSGNPKVGVYTRKGFFNPNSPPWQKDLYSMVCPNCHNQISEMMRRCNGCGNPNPYYMMDDDI